MVKASFAPLNWRSDGYGPGMIPTGKTSYFWEVPKSFGDVLMRLFIDLISHALGGFLRWIWRNESHW